MLEIGHELQLGRYRIKERLNQGGMGTVYLATDRNLSERLVAIKENAEISPETQQQFRHEAVVLARLTHPNLPRVTDHFIEPTGRQYLVMDYIAGDDLRQIMLKRVAPLPEAEALEWIDQVMDALEYMHGWIDTDSGVPSPIIHRDIKPANIKRTRNGRIVLVDFGLAKYYAEEGTLTGASAVTPGYSPLEQYTGGTDIRSDIYALGATLYMLLTGEKPPASPLIASGTPLPPPRKRNPTLSRTIERVILRAMQVAPENRFQSVREMRAALTGTSFLRGDRNSSTTARSQLDRGAGQRAGRQGTGLWVRVISLIALITVVVVAVGVLPTILERWGFLTGIIDVTTATPTTSFDQANAGTGNQITAGNGAIQATANLTTTTLIPTPTMLSAPAAILTPTLTATLTPAWTAPPIETATAIAAVLTPIDTATATSAPTATPLPTDAPLPTDTPTTTPSPLPSPTAMATATSTPQPLPTATSIPLPPPTATSTLLPTASATREPTHTPAFTVTWTPTPPPLTNTPAPSIAVAGDSKVNPADGAAYVYIPAGEFKMGSEMATDEAPVHTVATNDYWIMQTELTNAQYARCVAAAVCTPPKNDRWNDPGYADHPVTDVDWEQAKQYAIWVGGRLPTEAEWEKAARGTDERQYPWGNQAPDVQRLNYNFVQGNTTPAGQYAGGASFYGVLDMAGNVEEWVADRYAADYYASSPVQNPQGPAEGVLRVVRGGSFNSNGFVVRATARGKAIPDTEYDSVGFRVALSEIE